MTRDTWNGDANSPMSFNHWAYVDENPVNRIDPSGNCWIYLGGKKIWLSDFSYLCRINKPELSDCELTKPNPNLLYGGNEVMQFYQLLKDYKEGWWYSYDHKFDIDTFTGLMVIHEGGGDYGILEKLTAKAHAQQLYVGSYLPAYCPTGSCAENPILNMWAAYSGSTRKLVQTYVRNSKPIGEYWGLKMRGITDPTGQIIRARELGKLVLHPSSLNTDRKNALSNYASLKDSWVKKLKEAGFKPYKEYRNPGKRGIYYFTDISDGAAVFASMNQADYWNSVK